MKSKRILFAFFVLTMLAFVNPQIAAAKSPVSNEATAEARIAELQTRLEEIKAIDKDNLSREEKKALRGEVRQIKKEMAEVSGGIYLSVGALVLIALLLILLL